MKKVLTLCAGLLLSIGLLQAAAFEKEVEDRTLKVHLSSLKPLSAGENTFVLTLSKDAKIVEDAKVSVKAFMPAMPGMPAMESLADAASLGNGKYEVRINLAMGGTWQLHIYIIPAEGKKLRVKTSFDF